MVFDEHEQARALSALFEAFLPEPWFAGFFVWRYYADLDDVSQEHIWGFSPHGKRGRAHALAGVPLALGRRPGPRSGSVSALVLGRKWPKS